MEGGAKRRQIVKDCLIRRSEIDEGGNGDLSSNRIKVVTLKIVIENTIEQYEKLFSLEEERENYFRYSMMKPFEKMWNAIHVPLKAKQPHGYDD